MNSKEDFNKNDDEENNKEDFDENDADTNEEKLDEDVNEENINPNEEELGNHFHDYELTLRQDIEFLRNLMEDEESCLALSQIEEELNDDAHEENNNAIENGSLEEYELTLKQDREFLETLMRQDMEIATYRTIMENNESRLGLSQIEEAEDLNANEDDFPEECEHNLTDGQDDEAYGLDTDEPDFTDAQWLEMTRW